MKEPTIVMIEGCMFTDGDVELLRSAAGDERELYGPLIADAFDLEDLADRLEKVIRAMERARAAK